ncbi:MAG: Type secretion system effector, Hcp [Actinomycetota bacterium]|jgi:type VI protein secretion system component Hcp|nr:Type secretion system effector, Hcp [Actinomycetota bacterium]
MRSRYFRVASVLGAAVLCAWFLLPALSAVAAAGSSTLTVTGLTSSQTATDTDFAVSSFSWAVAGSSSAGSGGAGTGKATFDPLLVRHELKPAESLLIKSATEGRHLPEVTLVIQIGDVKAVEFLLTDSTITRAALSGKTAQPETSFDYRTITVTTKGSSYCFDLALSTACP